MTKTAEKNKSVKRKPTKDKPTKNQGWIKFHREEFEWLMVESPNLMKVWLWCRTQASRKKRPYRVTHPKRKTIEIELQPGQFIFGKYRASRRLGMAPTTFYRQMVKLQELGELELRADRNFTLVTIVNWASYESDGKIPDRKNDFKSKSKKGGLQKPKKADCKTQKSGPQNETEKSLESKKLQDKEKEGRTAKAEKADCKNPKRRTQNNNERDNKNERTYKKKRKSTALCRCAPRAGGSEEISLKKKTSKSKKEKTSRNEEFLRNLKNARAAARRNRARRGVATGEGNLMVEIAERLFGPAIPDEKEREQAEAGLMEAEDNLLQERKQKMAGEVTQ